MSKSTLPGLVLLAFLVLLAVFALTAAQPARAETYHHCTGFIDTLPATVTAFGTWCLRKDLSTNIASGHAITINASNVTIDCNGFRLNGSGAPPATNAEGIHAISRSNITVRNCTVTGFNIGILLFGGSPYLVEDNRATGARGVGIWVDGELSIIRRNRVSDVGNGTASGIVSGITAQRDGTVIVDNLISEIVAPDFAMAEAAGMFINGDGSRVENNHITLIVPNGAGIGVGIHSNSSTRSVFVGNTIINAQPVPGFGFMTEAGANAPVCARNFVRGFTTSAYDDCLDGGGNFSN